MKEIIKSVLMLCFGFAVCYLISLSPIGIEKPQPQEIDTVFITEIKTDSIKLDSLEREYNRVIDLRNKDTKRHYKSIKSLQKARKIIGLLNDSISIINLANKIQKGIECQDELLIERVVSDILIETKKLQSKTIANLKLELGVKYCKINKLNDVNLKQYKIIKRQQMIIKTGYGVFTASSLIIILLLL